MGNLIFLNPWLLTALLALPALWFLLRVMPPAPRRIALPSARFLGGLSAKEKTPNHTPWWLLLLRLCVAALVIIAFAKPIINPSTRIESDGGIRIVIDNGWASAHLWAEKMESAQSLIALAERSNLPVRIIPTAPEMGEKAPRVLGSMSAGEASAALQAMEPKGWPADYAALSRLDFNEDFSTTYWLSDGATDKGANAFYDALDAVSDVNLYIPEDAQLPLAIGVSKNDRRTVSIIAPDAFNSAKAITLQAVNEAGQIIGVQDIKREAFKSTSLDMPETVLRDAHFLRIGGRKSAGSTMILDNRYNRAMAGLVVPSGDENAAPFIEASYYISRAIEPYSDLVTGSFEEVLSDRISMLILPDIAAIPPAILDRLDAWVEGGGLLLRFAGPAMAAQGNHTLLPVNLRSGGRMLDGALTWDTPPKMSTFEKDSPFYGIAMKDDIEVRTQLLAQPDADLPQRIWASLDDGTPLITSKEHGRGRIVFVHTSAAPSWSDLPLSGAFVHIIARIVDISGAPQDIAQTQDGLLFPQWVLDGYGQRIKPDSTVKAIDSASIADIRVSSIQPAGLYARGAGTHVLNLGDQIHVLSAVHDSAKNAILHTYTKTSEQTLMPLLLLLAVVLFIVDWAVTISLSMAAPLRFKRRGVTGAAAVIMLISFAPSLAYAQSNLDYANGIYLAYIKSNDGNLNALSEDGLSALSDALTRRTSAEPSGVIGLDASSDMLNFFPFLYWPIAANQSPLASDALRNVQSYLDNGGTILFDTRGQDISAGSFERLIGKLNIPAMHAIPKDHVLGRSFYLLDAFPGRLSGNTLWVESTSASGRDGVSSVIIGANDWAGAWAQSRARSYRSGGGARQNEMAMRFGVNLVLYTLTGNYKADQVHVQHILDRLGQ